MFDASEELGALFSVIQSYSEPRYVFWFTEDTYLPHVVCTAFGFAHWLTRHSLRSVLIFMMSKRCCTSIVSAVPLLVGIEKKLWLISCFHE